MAELFVYTCRQCGAAYPGALEATERRQIQKETTGLCAACLERLFGLSLANRGAQSPARDPGAKGHQGK